MIFLFWVLLPWVDSGNIHKGAFDVFLLYNLAHYWAKKIECRKHMVRKMGKLLEVIAILYSWLWINFLSRRLNNCKLLWRIVCVVCLPSLLISLLYVYQCIRFEDIVYRKFSWFKMHWCELCLWVVGCIKDKQYREKKGSRNSPGKFSIVLGLLPSTFTLYISYWLLHIFML